MRNIQSSVFFEYWTDGHSLKKIGSKEKLTMDNDDIVYTIYIPNLSQVEHGERQD